MHETIHLAREGLRFAWLVLLALVLVGCGGGGEAPEHAVDTLGAGLPPADAAATGAMALNDTVHVLLAEYSIEMPATLPAGPTVFVVTNGGTAAHNFEVEGPGVEQVFPTNLAPGATEAMQVDLRPGPYEVYCPIDDHRRLGMSVPLTVTGAGPVPADTAAVDTTATVDTTAAGF